MRNIILALMGLFLISSASARKIAPPSEPMSFSDTARTVKLTVKPAGWGPAQVTITRGQASTAWPNTIELPSTAVVASVTDRVAFLGGFGDPGAQLGVIRVFDLSGGAIATVRLDAHISELPALSAGYRTVCCPSPWVHATRLLDGETRLQIDVCAKKTVVIDLKTGAVLQTGDVTPSAPR